MLDQMKAANTEFLRAAFPMTLGHRLRAINKNMVDFFQTPQRLFEDLNKIVMDQYPEAVVAGEAIKVYNETLKQVYFPQPYRAS